MSVRRLNKELIKYPKVGSIRFVELIDEDISKQRWEVKPSAGDSVAFDGVTIGLVVDVPKEYPFKAPKITLNRSLYHPNVHESTMCLDKVNNWNPKFNIMEVMEEVLHIIMYPNTDTALNTEAADLYTGDRYAYIMRAIKD
jgi:ubiquitin-conjugating enzyme E2 D/E